MFSTRRARRGAVRTTLGTIAAIAAIAPAHAYVLVTTPAGQPVRWPGRCVELWLAPATVVDVAPAEALAALERAAGTWAGIDCANVTTTVRGATCFDDVGLAAWPGPQNVVRWYDGAGSWPHTERVVALTSLTFDPADGRIVDADIEVNAEDFRFGVDGEPTLYDLEQTLTHEVGHALGLDHSEVAAATMYATSAPGETSKRALDDDDVAGLCASRPRPIGASPPQCAADLEPHAIEVPWCPTPREDGCGAAPSTLPGGAVVALLAALTLWLARRRARARAPFTTRSA